MAQNKNWATGSRMHHVTEAALFYEKVFNTMDASTERSFPMTAEGVAQLQRHSCAPPVAHKTRTKMANGRYEERVVSPLDRKCAVCGERAKATAPAGLSEARTAVSKARRELARFNASHKLYLFKEAVAAKGSDGITADDLAEPTAERVKAKKDELWSACSAASRTMGALEGQWDEANMDKLQKHWPCSVYGFDFDYDNDNDNRFCLDCVVNRTEDVVAKYVGTLGGDVNVADFRAYRETFKFDCTDAYTQIHRNDHKYAKKVVDKDLVAYKRGNEELYNAVAKRLKN